MHLLDNQLANTKKTLKRKVAAGQQSAELYEFLRQQNNTLSTNVELIEYIKKLAQVENAKNEIDKAKYIRMKQQLYFDHFDETYIVYSDEKGTRKLLKKIHDNQVKNVDLEDAYSMMLKIADGLDLPLSKRAAVNAAETALHASNNVVYELPPSFSLDETELTFNRIRINLIDGPTPISDSIFNRFKENSEPAKAFIWSLFEKNKCQQYLWLYGEGRDGKGSIIRLITSILGKTACEALAADDNYWLAKLVGKRFGYFNELNNTSLVLGSKFKQVTGGDNVSIDEKYEQSYSALLDVRFIVTTNNPISITSRKSDINRIIYCAIEPTTEVIENFETRLFEEAPAFLYKCKVAYEKLYKPSLEKIECTYLNAREAAERFEVQFSYLYETFIEHGEKIPEHTTNAAFFGFFNEKLGRNSQEYSKFLMYLERNFKLKSEVFVTGYGKSVKGFKNLRILSK